MFGEVVADAFLNAPPPRTLKAKENDSIMDIGKTDALEELCPNGFILATPDEPCGLQTVLHNPNSHDGLAFLELILRYDLTWYAYELSDKGHRHTWAWDDALAECSSTVPICTVAPWAKSEGVSANDDNDRILLDAASEACGGEYILIIAGSPRLWTIMGPALGCDPFLALVRMELDAEVEAAMQPIFSRWLIGGGLLHKSAAILKDIGSISDYEGSDDGIIDALSSAPGCCINSALRSLFPMFPERKRELAKAISNASPAKKVEISDILGIHIPDRMAERMGSVALADSGIRRNTVSDAELIRAFVLADQQTGRRVVEELELNHEVIYAEASSNFALRMLWSEQQAQQADLDGMRWAEVKRALGV